MRSFPFFVLAIAACGHSEPFVSNPDRAERPFTAEGQLTVNALGLVDWAGDGSGILVLTARPTEQYDLPLLAGTVRKDPLDNCLGLIPRDGGSMTWQFCDRTLSHYRDSNDVFVTAAIGTGGELLYVLSHQRPGFFFPVGLEAELWLGSTHKPYAARRQLLRLYRDDNGHPTVTPDQINWLSDVQWAGSNAFVARAFYLRPDAVTTEFGIAYGTITRDTTTLALVPGTAGLGLFVVAEAGATLVYARSQVVIASIPVTGGPERIVATLPAAPARGISGLSCQQQRCVAVTQESGSNGISSSNLWLISLTTGSATILRSFNAAQVPRFVRLSPDGSRVVVQKWDGRLYLLTDLPL